MIHAASPEDNETKRKTAKIGIYVLTAIGVSGAIVTGVASVAHNDYRPLQEWVEGYVEADLPATALLLGAMRHYHKHGKRYDTAAMAAGLAVAGRSEIEVLPSLEAGPDPEQRANGANQQAGRAEPVAVIHGGAQPSPECAEDSDTEEDHQFHAASVA